LAKEKGKRLAELSRSEEERSKKSKSPITIFRPWKAVGEDMFNQPGVGVGGGGEKSGLVRRKSPYAEKHCVRKKMEKFDQRRRDQSLGGAEGQGLEQGESFSSLSKGKGDAWP